MSPLHICVSPSVGKKNSIIEYTRHLMKKNIFND